MNGIHTIKQMLGRGGSICHDCAKENGAVWPEGHLATWWRGECSFCNKEKDCCCVSDYNWKGVQMGGVREF